MGNTVRNVDIMRDVQNSTAPLNDMLNHNDLQGAATKLREDLRSMDHDAFMVELGQVQRCTADTPTHIVMHPITDDFGALQGKDISLVTKGVDVNQNPIDCNIPIGQLYNDRAMPCQEPLVVRPDCAFELTARPGDGWYHGENGAFLFRGRFPDGRVHLDIGGLNLNIGIGHEPRIIEESGRPFLPPVGRGAEIIERPIFDEGNRNVFINRVPPIVIKEEIDRHKRP